uniref:Uncharacterized protein n=1 Tax=Tetraselmis sp. GSL018 TaxID=582737 RepID=A0A061S723_9CHLO
MYWCRVPSLESSQPERNRRVSETAQNKTKTTSAESQDSVCLRKQLSHKPGGRCSFVCPKHSCIKPGVKCVEKISDCQCKPGLILDTAASACVEDASTCYRWLPSSIPECSYRCPRHSCVKRWHTCIDSAEDCTCQHGLVMDLARAKCVKPEQLTARRKTSVGDSATGFGKLGAGEGSTMVGRPPSAVQPRGRSKLLMGEAQLESVPEEGAHAPDRQPPREVRFGAASAGMVETDLGGRRDAAVEIDATLQQVLQLGAQLTLLLAFARGLAHIYSSLAGTGRPHLELLGLAAQRAVQSVTSLSERSPRGKKGRPEA